MTAGRASCSTGERSRSVPQKILGLDLGSWSVKGVLLETGFRSHQVIGVREIRVKDGDPETKLERQIEALRALHDDPSLRADAYVVGFPGDQTTTRFITLPF